MTTRDPGLQPERTILAWRRTFLTMVVSDFFIWRAWATSLTHHAGDIQGSALGLGIAAAASAGATAIFGACILKRNAGLRDNKSPHELLLRTVTAATITVAASTITAILLGR